MIDSPAALLSVRELSQHFPARGVHHGVVRAVDGISFDIHRGKTFGLVGESGCGKSTAARSILRLYTPTAGAAFFDGEDVTHAPPARLLSLRKRMQMIFQDPYSSLNARMTVRDIIAEPLQAHRAYKSRSDETARVYDMLERVGLTREHANRYPHEFSGGQRQRIGIARALILRPELIICDEPISALDVSIQAQIINLLKDFQDELNLTYMFIAHDLSMVRYVSDEVGVMYLGRLVETSPAEEIFRRPLHPYTQGLLASIPTPDPRAARLNGESALTGDVPSPINLPSGCRFRTRCPRADSKCAAAEPPLESASPGRYVACFNVHEIGHNAR